MGGIFGTGLRGQGTLLAKAIRQAKRFRIVLASIGAPTSFEQKLLIKAGKKEEILFSSKTFGTFRPVIENNHIIGYYRASSGFYQLLDQQRRRRDYKSAQMRTHVEAHEAENNDCSTVASAGAAGRKARRNRSWNHGKLGG